MKRKRGLALLISMVFILTVFAPTTVFAGTSIHLHADGASAQVYLEDPLTGDPILGWADTPVAGEPGVYEMNPGGIFTLTDNGSEHLPIVIWFRVDGETYIVNPIADRDPDVTVGEEGNLGAGTNNYWIAGDPGAAIDISKESDFDSYYPGDTVNYTVYVFNSGTDEVSKLSVVDTLDLDPDDLVTVLEDRYDKFGPGELLTFEYSFTIPLDYSESTLTNTVRAITEDKSNLDESATLTVNILEPETYVVTYYGNTNTGGTAPVDSSNPYLAGDTVTVLGQGDLVKANHTFTGWNTEADGSGDSYAPAATFTMPAADVDLYAQWSEDEQYTVTYNGNGNTGGTAPVDSSNPYYAGETVTVEGVGSLVKANHTFTGWNTAADGSGDAYAPAATFTMPAANVVLYAQWTEDAKYTVTYNGNGNTGGTAPVDASSPYYASETVTVEGVGSLVKANHTFTGWNTSADGSGDAYAPAATFTMPAANVVLYAQWTEDAKYTVTYDGNGNTSGTAPVDASSPYYAGETVTVKGPGDLAKENHTFTGWNSEADGSGTAYGSTFTMPAANVILYAQWTEDAKYTVTYNGNGNTGGTAPVDASSPYYAGETVTVEGVGSLVKANHTFTGWNSAPDGSGTAYSGTFTMPAANVILYAQWTEDAKYTVTYDGNGNTGGTAPVDASSPYYAGETVTVEGVGSLVKANHTFAGWNSEADGSGTTYGSSFTMPAANVILYAQWTEDAKYTVTYNGNGNTGGTAPVDASSPYYAGETVTVEGVGDLVKANHTFSGWNSAADGSGTAYSGTFTMPAANVVLYAQWTEDGKYAVTYYGNGADSGSQTDASSPYYAGTEVTVLDQGTFVKANHTFTGWNTQADGEGTAYAATDTFNMPEANVDLFAQWIEDDKYAVTYYGNGADSGSQTDASSPYYAGSEVTVLGQGTLVKANHTFTGWNTQADGEGTAYAATDTFNMPSADVDLFAQWSEDETYTVTYAPGDHGTFAPDVTSGLYIGDATPSAPTPTGESGWIFNGWSPVPTSTVTGNATYVAQWRQPPPPPPQWNPSIAVTITPSETSVEAGSEVTFTMVVSNTGNTVLNNVEVVNEDLDFSTFIPILYVGGSETFTVTKELEIGGTFTVVAEGTSPQVVAVNDTDVTAVEVFIIPPPPPPPPENPPTGAIPFDVYSVSGLLAMGAGLFALITRKKEDDEDED